MLAILVSFAGLYFTFPPQTLSVLLNGLFAGAMTAIGVTYYKLLWDAWFNPDDFNRVRQMTLTIGGQWVVISLFITTSIYTNSGNFPVSYFVASLFARYLATVVAVFQVTAPDYGDGLFYGADRKFLWLGLIVGTLVGVGVVIYQGL
jgi:hypothetical protein